MEPYYVKETKKSFDKACEDLETAVKANKFGVQFVHSITESLRKKGQTVEEDIKVFEVCNPVVAANVLAKDVRINMALPCRISVYTDKGTVKIGMIKPLMMLGMLTTDDTFQVFADEVEKATEAMIDEASKDE